ncbi:hypothetical protein At1D1108_45650 (plasmid) [Agrobacterium tumefaciens]|nr:hypothetical protein At1D1108_45650 [Agrobacterium tumefaciens]
MICLNANENRIIPVAGHAAVAWAYLMTLAKRNGRDGLTAATAFAHPLTLATRNIKDLEGFGIKISDQWVD